MASGRAPESYPARALWDINPDDYGSTIEAVQAAMAKCPRFRCRNCENVVWWSALKCGECGGCQFDRITPDGGHR